MTKRETFTLIALIAVYYEQFDFDQKKVDSWHQILKEHHIDELKNNLITHVASSPYPPKISDLVRKPETCARAIPNVEETTYIFTHKRKPASEEVVQAELRKMREILGIERGVAQ
ncbi:replicative helicase loader/inhibitor [Lederbergia citrea]|uniref:Replicative helicase inhibitor G39P N-terminal domain-containing protein n=1 Tax=Lederbergia citrea TaxID=2833581 RepID=A0A942UKW8_9BACI|nr:replicative helicase loader/inhibitor [Lederbergia citrea]MBS4223341.1 hypothetical protein [Lederbergia citrea]